MNNQNHLFIASSGRNETCIMGLRARSGRANHCMECQEQGPEQMREINR